MIAGGGYIARRVRRIFHGLGADVTLVYRGEHFLRGFDDDVRERLRAEMAARGRGRLRRDCRRDRKARASCLHAGTDDGDASRSTRSCSRSAARRTRRARSREGRRGIDRGGGRSSTSTRALVASIYAIGDVTNRLQPDAGRDPRGDAFADTAVRRQADRPSITT